MVSFLFIPDSKVSFDRAFDGILTAGFSGGKIYVRMRMHDYNDAYSTRG